MLLLPTPDVKVPSCLKYSIILCIIIIVVSWTTNYCIFIADVAGEILSFDFKFRQAGVVYLVTNFASVNAFVYGDRSFDRFGYLLKVKMEQDFSNGFNKLVIRKNKCICKMIICVQLS